MRFLTFAPVFALAAIAAAAPLAQPQYTAKEVPPVNPTPTPAPAETNTPPAAPAYTAAPPPPAYTTAPATPVYNTDTDTDTDTDDGNTDDVTTDGDNTGEVNIYDVNTSDNNQKINISGGLGLVVGGIGHIGEIGTTINDLINGKHNPYVPKQDLTKLPGFSKLAACSVPTADIQALAPFFDAIKQNVTTDCVQTLINIAIDTSTGAMMGEGPFSIALAVVKEVTRGIDITTIDVPKLVDLVQKIIQQRQCIISHK
ncbi:hypothetical protein GQ54DRAFT_298280 [Martensiomyces pterosporus]|nr:hypothetical protein GQ54DRAFT_298280 [Martensiomyces pterosporus]